MRKNIIRIPIIQGLLLFTYVHIIFYLGVYQLDYYIYCLSANSWIIEEAKIINVNLKNHDNYRAFIPMYMTGTVKYDVDGVEYYDKVLMSLDERKGDIINVAIKKNNPSKARRCEIILDEFTSIICYISAGIIIIIITISLIQNAAASKKNSS